METYSCISSSSSSSNHRHHMIFSTTPRNLQSSHTTRPAEAEQSMNTHDEVKYISAAGNNYLQNTSRHMISSSDGLRDEVMETKSFDHAVFALNSSAGDHSGITSENTRNDVKHGSRKEAEDGGDYDHDDEEKINNNGDGGGGKKMKAVEIKKVRRPRFAFQTRSQVDILDDGYRWRKYGQKAVKNNNFPRSYYRCTHQDCNVKKQVQRLSKDEEVVVTTYEGTHTHPIQTNTDNFEQILKQMQIYTTF